MGSYSVTVLFLLDYKLAEKTGKRGLRETWIKSRQCIVIFRHRWISVDRRKAEVT